MFRNKTSRPSNVLWLLSCPLYDRKIINDIKQFKDDIRETKEGVHLQIGMLIVLKLDHQFVKVSFIGKFTWKTKQMKKQNPPIESWDRCILLKARECPSLTVVGSLLFESSNSRRALLWCNLIFGMECVWMSDVWMWCPGARDDFSKNNFLKHRKFIVKNSRKPSIDLLLLLR